ncbi:thiol:disulfide interchange protein DsbA/DsbL [Echinimonas agarilytica]|uniref:Thiol:disulfide interchange protein n=1 Tax=Echinimonas agarilytica TaxID=1215918 RepID=A0AA42B5X9_9GAMM|nr:thiol:disulfide interchange protein DsbA/DsbL [Echinimonas agarilytica]MCM2678188.1 thiol:disulfide interchange protein DsbA/DsbL [Echinimonas agarilytica]
MRKLLVTLLAIVALPMAAFAADYKEGTHYEVISSQATTQPEVMEFFSYYCPHCWKFEPIVEALEDGLQGVELKRGHVEFLPPRNPQLGQMMTRAFAAAQVLKVVKPFSEQVYQRNFVQRKMVATMDDVRDIFTAIGVKKEDFNGAYNSFPVNSLVAQMAQKTKKYGVSGTPSVIVNGKYKVLAGGLSDSDDFVADYVKLVNYLVTLK